MLWQNIFTEAIDKTVLFSKDFALTIFTLVSEALE